MFKIFGNSEKIEETICPLYFKGFEPHFYCDGTKYEIGQIIKDPDFYFIDNTDSINFDQMDSWWFVEIEPLGNVKKIGNKFYCDSVRLKSSIDPKQLEIMDQTGYYLVNSSLRTSLSEENVKRVQEILLEKDKTGIYLYMFALEFEDEENTIDLDKIEKAIIEKDKSGELCFSFMKNIRFSNKLKNSIFEKDVQGEIIKRLTGMEEIPATEIVDQLKKRNIYDRVQMVDYMPIESEIQLNIVSNCAPSEIVEDLEHDLALHERILSVVAKLIKSKHI